MPSTEAFADLIRRVRHGDEVAATELFERYGKIFFKKVRNRLESSAARAQVDCDDVCQTVFKSLFLRLRWGQYELRDEKDLVALLFRMADNKAIAKIRKAAVRPDAGAPGDVDLGRVAGHGPTPSRIVSGKEVYEEAVRRLTPEERQIQSLRDEGLEWAAVAERLGGTAEGRRKQWERACARVEKELHLED